MAPTPLIVDPEAISKATGQSHAVVDYRASPDGRHLAYSLQVGGSEIGHAARDRRRFGQAGRRADRSHPLRLECRGWTTAPVFFTSRLREGFDKLPPTERFGDRTRHFRSIKGGDHRPVFSPTLNADLKLPVYANGFVAQIPGTKLAACVVTLGVERHQLAYIAPLADAIAGKAQWRQAGRR